MRATWLALLIAAAMFWMAKVWAARVAWPERAVCSADAVVVTVPP